MSVLSIKLLFEQIRVINAASIGSAYMGIDTPLENPARMIHVVNNTDADLMFSWNGVIDHFMLPEGGFLLLDIVSNKTISDGFYIAQGSRLYVKEIGNPTTGAVYFSVMYGSDN